MNPLEQAVEKIEQGWCTGNLVKDGKVCALGALAIVELNADMRVLDTALINTMDEKAVQAHYDEDSRIYDELDSLRSVQVLAEEIMETEWFSDLVHFSGESREHLVKRFTRVPSDIVWRYNDRMKDQNEVIETFKHAAKRYDK